MLQHISPNLKRFLDIHYEVSLSSVTVFRIRNGIIPVSSLSMVAILWMSLDYLETGGVVRMRLFHISR